MENTEAQSVGHMRRNSDHRMSTMAIACGRSSRRHVVHGRRLEARNIKEYWQSVQELWQDRSILQKDLTCFG